MGYFLLNFASWRYCTVAQVKDDHRPVSQIWQDDVGMARIMSGNVFTFRQSLQKKVVD